MFKQGAESGLLETCRHSRDAIGEIIIPAGGDLMLLEDSRLLGYFESLTKAQPAAMEFFPLKRMRMG